VSSPAVRYRFHFDASACAGCKACQIACKDKHGLEVGRLWRRVYEVTGGGWRRSGSAWRSDVFAFHLSVACNHCQRPICVEVCPSRALRQRDDGIVLLDTDRCLGCSYCEWACPYGALQYDKSRGCMTKCTFCVDEIDAGRPPVCVTSCPLRVLEYGETNGALTDGALTDGALTDGALTDGALTDGALTDGALTQDPLPDPRITRPALVMREHRDAGRAREESIAVVPQKRHELRAWSLVAFTLLAQLAAGTVLVGSVSGWIAMSPDSELRAGPEWLVAGVAIAVALLLSLRHLGAPRRALLAACNWRTSWLSREIIAGVAFTVACVAAVVLGEYGSGLPVGLLWLASLFALTLLVSMSGVYMLRTVPTWNSLRTPVSFAATALVLGSVTTAVLHQAGGGVSGPSRLLELAVAALIVGRLIEHWGDRTTAAGSRAVRIFRTLSPLSALGSVALLGTILVAGDSGGTLLVLATVLALISEVAARHRFFEVYSRTGI
jgi:anaerobic dimethyl sulfoxide reductase subunit B (iron-sulfur subunit)